MLDGRGLTMSSVDPSRPVIVHIVHRLDYGGLENGVVNLINGTSAYLRHVVISLTEATDFRRRLSQGVPVCEIGKRPGKDLGAYVRLYRLLRKLRPTIVHTRNVGTLDCCFIAFLAGVPIRVHGEHGWDVFDPDGENPKYRRVRRVFGRFVNSFVTVSEDLRALLVSKVGLSPDKVTRICNGVDTRRFRPVSENEALPLPERWLSHDSFVVGSVTRFSPIKDPLNLVEAFIQLRASDAGRNLRLVMVGDGDLRSEAIARLEAAGVAGDAWLPGSRDDIPKLLRGFDLFVLGSQREGISNTVLEAMATGLPVVATATGGNLELVLPDETGMVVPPGDRDSLAAAIKAYMTNTSLARAHGVNARKRAVSQFSLDGMIENYLSLYETCIAAAKL